MPPICVFDFTLLGILTSVYFVVGLLIYFATKKKPKMPVILLIVFLILFSVTAGYLMINLSCETNYNPFPTRDETFAGFLSSSVKKSPQILENYGFNTNYSIDPEQISRVIGNGRAFAFSELSENQICVQSTPEVVKLGFINENNKLVFEGDRQRINIYFVCGKSNELSEKIDSIRIHHINEDMIPNECPNYDLSSNIMYCIILASTK